MSDARAFEADAGAARDETVHRVGAQASDVVRQAADVLEEELSGGIAEARRLQDRVTDRGRLEPEDLDELTERVRRNAHQLVDLVSERFEDLRADDVQELKSRLTKDVHQILDAALDLTAMVPPTLNRLADRVTGATRVDGADEPTRGTGEATSGAGEAAARTGAAEASGTVPPPGTVPPSDMAPPADTGPAGTP